VCDPAPTRSTTAKGLSHRAEGPYIAGKVSIHRGAIRTHPFERLELRILRISW
jgi:hypothetical protein